MRMLLSALLLTIACQASAHTNIHVVEFVDLFKRYCHASESNLAVEKRLRKDGHKRNQEFYDAYEIMIGGVDYAITPLPDDCTADVRLIHRGKLLFTQTELVDLLIKEFALTEVESRKFDDIALNNKNTVVLQSNFTDKIERSYRLLYPENNQASYYMTLTLRWPDQE